MSPAGIWGMMLFSGISGLLLLVVLGFGIYWVARRLRQDDATMVLRRQFAEGAITEEEYQRRLSILKQ